MKMILLIFPESFSSFFRPDEKTKAIFLDRECDQYCMCSEKRLMTLEAFTRMQLLEYLEGEHNRRKSHPKRPDICFHILTND